MFVKIITNISIETHLTMYGIITHSNILFYKGVNTKWTTIINQIYQKLELK